MPKYTKEKAQAVIENMGEALGRLYAAPMEVPFSDDPEKRHIQQVMLFHELRAASDFSKDENNANAERDKKYRTAAEKILDPNNPMMNYLYSQPEGTVKEVLEEVTMANNARHWREKAAENSLDPEKAIHQNKERPQIGFREKVLKCAFSPEPDAHSLPEHYDVPEIAQMMQDAHTEADSVRIQAPEGFTDREATMLSFAVFYASDDLMTRYYGYAKGAKGSTLVETEHPENNGRELMEDVFKQDNRPNLQYYGVLLPEARRRAASVLDRLREVPKPAADALKRSVDAYMKTLTGLPGSNSNTWVNDAQIVSEMYGLLNRPELKEHARFSEQEVQRIESVKTELKLHNELKELKLQLNRRMLESALSPKEFMQQPENRQAVSRMLAMQLHVDNIREEFRDIENAASYRSFAVKQAFRTDRRLSIFEVRALNNYDAHVSELQERPQVAKALERYEGCASMEELVGAMGQIEPVRNHSYMDVAENTLIPDSINSFLNNAVDKNSIKGLTGKLRGLTAMNGKPCPVRLSEAEMQKRIGEYTDVIAAIERLEENGTVIQGPNVENMGASNLGELLKTDLRREIEGLQGAMENLPYNKREGFREYFDKLGQRLEKNENLLLFDEEGKKLGAPEAKALAEQGRSFIMHRFAENECVGKAEKVTYRPDDLVPAMGKPGFISRTVDLSAPVKKDPRSQLEQLKHLRGILAMPDPFYVVNSTEFNDTVKALDTVIKAHETLDEGANIRQVWTLKGLYQDLQEKAEKYLRVKADKLKVGDERGSLRMDVIRTMTSITESRHVAAVCGGIFPEEKALQNSVIEAKPIRDIMKKWDPESPDFAHDLAYRTEDFAKDRDTVFEFMRRSMASQERGESAFYSHVAVCQGIDRFEKAMETAAGGAENMEKTFGPERVWTLKAFQKKVQDSMIQFAGMDGEIRPKAKLLDAPQKNAPQVGM